MDRASAWSSLLVAYAEALETAGLVRLTIKCGVVDFAVVLDLEEATNLSVSIAHAARAALGVTGGAEG